MILIPNIRSEVWGFDFNHDSQFTRELVDSIAAYWMTEYKIDGFRYDFTKGFSNNTKDGSDPWGSKYDASELPTFSGWLPRYKSGNRELS